MTDSPPSNAPSPFAADAAPVPGTGEFATAWVAYACFFFGALLWWPSLIGLVIAYARRGEAAAGFLDSHYRWQIRSFWWASLASLAAFALMVAGVWPILADVLHSLPDGDWQAAWDGGTLVRIDWRSIFAAAGLAVAGGCVLLVTILWLLYRLIRGALRLADARPAP